MMLRRFKLLITHPIGALSCVALDVVNSIMLEHPHPILSCSIFTRKKKQIIARKEPDVALRGRKGESGARLSVTPIRQFYGGRNSNSGASTWVRRVTGRVAHPPSQTFMPRNKGDP